MAKNIVKEIIIMLLFVIVILLIVSLALYEYVPSNKQLPEAVSYSTPQEVKEKLVQIEGVDEDEVILTYELNQADLNNYQRINEYKPGKTNPFSTYKSEPATSTQDGSTTGTSSGTSSSSSSSGSSTGSSSGNSSGQIYTAPTTQGGVNQGNYTNKSGTK